MKDIPIIDAHHHFWDLSLKKNPWLNPDNQIPFRYGDYKSICKNFLTTDYFEVTKNHNIVKTIHMETEWLHKLFEMTGFPNALVAQAWFDRNDIEKVLENQSKYYLSLIHI